LQYKSLIFITLDFQAYKRSKFGKFLDLENIRSIWPLTIEVPMITPRVNRQIGGDKLKSVLKFGTCHVTSRYDAHAQ